MTRVLTLLFFAVAVCAATSAPPAPLTVAGVTIGAPVIGLVKTLGLPDIVQTEDDGHFWQWSRAGGLDREVIADDDLNVKSVMVALAAPPSPSASPQPPDVPMLGLDAASSAMTAKGLGAIDARQLPGPASVWTLDGSVLAAEFVGGRVVRLRAIDASYARTLGYFGKASPQPVHHAPQLLHEFIPPYLPHADGTVIVRVAVDATGKVSGTTVLVSSHDVQLDAWEQEGMRRSTFAPATCGGTPCAGVYIDDGGLWGGHS